MSPDNKSSTKTAGHITRRDLEANRPPKDEPWAWLTRQMMESAAYRALSIHAYKVLDRILREHMAQGGKENGRLKVTWRDFKKDGVQSRRITGAIAEVEALGFAKRTFPGRRSCGEDRGAPAQYRLTWLPVFEPDNAKSPTNEWKRFGDDYAEAKRTAQVAAGRTLDQRSRPSILVPAGQDIEGACKRGVQKAVPRGVQKNGGGRIQRGVQILGAKGGAEEKDFEVAAEQGLAEVSEACGLPTLTPKGSAAIGVEHIELRERRRTARA